MAKTRQSKEDVVTQLSDKIKDSKAVVFANLQGLTVLDTQDLKNKGKEQGVFSTLSKKTLLKIALKNNGIDADTKSFGGGVGVFWSESDEITPAKIVANFAKGHEIVNIFGGVFNGHFIDAAEVKQLATLPGKEELLAQLVGTLVNPIRGFVTVLNGNQRGLVTVLDAIAKQKA